MSTCSSGRTAPALAAVACAAVAACSNSTPTANQAVQRNAAPTSSAPTSSAEAASAAPGSAASPSTANAAPVLPGVVPMPDEGRNFDSCRDGRCRVHVKPGDRLVLDGVLDVASMTLQRISRSAVSAEFVLAGGAGVVTFHHPLTQGALDDGGRPRLFFLEITGSTAVMQIDDRFRNG